MEINFSTKHFIYTDLSLNNCIRWRCDKHLLIMYIFRTDSKDNSLSFISSIDKFLCFWRWKFNISRSNFEDNFVTLLLAYSIKEIHLWWSDESCNEEVAWGIIKYLWCIYLLNNTCVHNYDSGSQCHSFCLVMCYVDDCCTKSLMKFGNLDTHLSTKFSIQVGKWFIHKKCFWLSYNCRANRNTLLLPAG